MVRSRESRESREAGELEREVRKGEREEEQEQEREGELRFEDLSGVERWLLSRVQQHIRATTDALEHFQCRRALQHAFFEFESDLRWFRRRTRWEQTQGAERERLRSVLRFVLDVWVRLLAPFIPHACEEIWSRMGKNPDGKQFVSLAAFPKASAALEDRKALLEEQFLSLVVEDVNEILKVTGISPQKIVLFVAPAWKREVFRSVLKMLADGKGVKEMLPALMREEHLRPHRKELPTLVKGIVERVQFLRAKMALGAEAVEELAGIEELSVLLAAREFLEREFKCRCEIYDADAVDESVDPKKRRKNAIPLRPAIFVL
nr:class I tRNA ligase family protein [Methanophagales archaeon]